MNKRKNYLSLKYLILSILLVLGLFVISCEGLKSRIIEIDNLKIAYVIGKGNLEDKGLSELGYQGIKKAIDKYSIKVNVLEGNKNNEESFQRDFKKITEKSDLIIVMGDEFKAAINAVSNNYRDKKIAVLGEGMKESNIQDITFRYEEGGFLMGVIAGKETRNSNIGFIGVKGSDTDKLLSGYIAGVKVSNSKASKKLLSNENVKLIAGNLTDNEILEVGQELYKNGVDIIFTNLQGKSVEIFKAAKANGRYAMAVGMDNKKIYPEYSENIISSLMIKTDEVVYEIIKEVEEGKFKSGENNCKTLGLKEKAMDIAPSTEDFVRKDILELLEKYKKDIINKKISIPKTRQEVLEY